MTEGNESSPNTHEVSLKEYDAYFKKIETGSWSRELTLLSEAPFFAAGERAEQEGWFVGENAIMQGLMASKIANLLHLSPYEKDLFVKAALLTSPMRREQYKRFKASEITLDQRAALDAEGAQVLKGRGVDPYVLEVARAGSTHLSTGYASVLLKPEGEEGARRLILTKYLHYVHNSVSTPAGAARVTGRSDIGDWRPGVLGSIRNYKHIAEELISVNGRMVPYFDVEAMINEEAEAELRLLIQKENPTIILKEDQSLYVFLRNAVYHDIAERVFPEEVHT